MEDVKKVIDGINKAHNRASVFYRSFIVVCILGWAIILAGLPIYLNLAFPSNENTIVLTKAYVGAVLALLMLMIGLGVARDTLKKRAWKDTEELQRKCVRLKPISQGTFDLLSVFVSPDKVMFFRAPDNENNEYVVLIIMKDGTIRESPMKTEEATAILEPMFK